jgi:hypothetical protein
MGYSCAQTAVKNFIYLGSKENASYTAKGPDAIALSLPLYTVLPEKVLPAQGKQVDVMSKENTTERPRFVIKGGFYKMADAKRHLFFAGRLHKPATHTLTDKTI